mgnify:FL=1
MKYYVIDRGCKLCDACYWACPAKAIRIVDDVRAEIIQDQCRHCGVCYDSCANEAISIYDDAATAQAAIMSFAQSRPS